MNHQHQQLSLKQLSTINREFLSTASQDLRKPLSLIMDITSQSLHKASTEPSARAADLLNNLNLIGKSASYINNITECILDMQTSGFGQLRLTKTPINLENLINETLEKFKNRALEKHIRLNSSPLDEKLVIEADHIQKKHFANRTEVVFHGPPGSTASNLILIC